MKAMILAAGKGKRMLPLTQHTPKPLLEVGGVPMIVRHIQNLAAAGIRDIVINVNYLGDRIMTYLADGSAYGVTIHYSDERQCAEELETGGGVIKALPLLGDEPFALIAGDIVTDFPFSHLIKPLADDMLGHLVLVDNPEHHTTGDFGLKDGIVQTNATKKFNFAGICYLHPKLFSDLTPHHAPLFHLLKPHIAAGHFSGEHYQGLWRNIGTPGQLANRQKIE